MIEISTEKRAEFLAEIQGKKLFCLGGGRIFHKFIEEYPHLEISGVIDNYLGGKNSIIVSHEKKISVMTLPEFVKKHSRNSAIVVSVAYFADVLDELEKQEKLDGTKCYIAKLLMAEYAGQYGAIVRDIESYRYEQTGALRNLEGHKTKRFQIGECNEISMDAGEKAPRDVKEIATQAGYRYIHFRPFDESDMHGAHGWNAQHNRKEWEQCYESIPQNAVILLQHPFRKSQKMREVILRKLKEERNVKVISLVHDVEEIRKSYYNEYFQREFQFMLDIADVLIVHNDRMEQFFIDKGIEHSKLVKLGIFDYLTDKVPTGMTSDRTVIIAGNLDPSKGRFIEALDELRDVNFRLFGPGYQSNNRNVEYCGTFPANEIASALHGGFGLIWNGDSLDSCTGNMGNYLRFNNPHKLSLYIAAKMPVIVWKMSAVAEFVEKNCLGVAVESLLDLPDILKGITEEDYLRYRSSAAAFSTKVRNGFFTRQVLKAAEQKIGIEQESC